MTELSIEGGRALIGGEFLETSLRVAGRGIAAVGADARAAVALDASPDFSHC